MEDTPSNNNPQAAKAGVIKDKPRRPLSAYNLFFRFKRQKILELCKDGDVDRAAIERIVKSTPGLENVSHDAIMVLPDEDLDKFRSDLIRAELENKLTPMEAEEMKARSHRKTQFNHGLSFLDMTTIISSSWKECDANSKKLFEDLAEEGRSIRHQLLTEYAKSQEGDETANSPQGNVGKKNGKKMGGTMIEAHFDSSIKGNTPHLPSMDGGGHNNTAEVTRKDHLATKNDDNLKMNSAVAAMASASLSQPNLSIAGFHMSAKSSWPTTSSFFLGASSNNGMPNALNYSNHPSYQSSFFNAHSSDHQRPLFNTSQLDKVKIAELEVANASMKQMLEKLVAVNADLESQKSHLIQLVGHLTAENTTLKKNRDHGTSSNHHQLLIQNRSIVRRTSVCSSDSGSGSHKEMLPTSRIPQKKRHRVSREIDVGGDVVTDTR